MRYHFLILILIPLYLSCSPNYKNPGKLEIRGFEIGDKVDTSLFKKYRNLYFPNHLDGWNYDNVSNLPKRYQGLPIGIWLLKADSTIALTLIEDIILKITISHISQEEKENLEKEMNFKFGGEGKNQKYEESHPLQSWVTYWNLKTWETSDVIFQMGTADMRKPKDPEPNEYKWNLVYSDLKLEDKIIEKYKKK